MAKVFSQMSEVAENSIGVVFGYHIVAGMLALVVLPGLPLLDGSLLCGAMWAIVAALLAGRDPGLDLTPYRADRF